VGKVAITAGATDLDNEARPSRPQTNCVDKSIRMATSIEDIHFLCEGNLTGHVQVLDSVREDSGLTASLFQ